MCVSLDASVCWLLGSVLLLRVCVSLFFFFKQKTAYEMRISDWSSDVCSSDLYPLLDDQPQRRTDTGHAADRGAHDAFDGLPRSDGLADRQVPQIGRASCRERVCQNV